jgi:hypothetical protein
MKNKWLQATIQELSKGDTMIGYRAYEQLLKDWVKGKVVTEYLIDWEHKFLLNGGCADKLITIQDSTLTGAQLVQLALIKSSKCTKV